MQHQSLMSRYVRWDDKMMLCNQSLSCLRGWFSYRDPKRRGCTHHTQRCGVLQEWRALGGPDCQASGQWCIHCRLKLRGVLCSRWRLVDVSSFQSVCFRGRFAFDRLWWIQRTPSTQWSALLVASPTKWKKSWKRCPTRLTSRARKWRSTALWWARSLHLRRSLHRFCASWVRMPESTWVPPFKRWLGYIHVRCCDVVFV